MIKHWHVLINLFLVYLSWGSVYICFKYTQEVLGPFYACAARMIFAGIILCLFVLLKGNWLKCNFRIWFRICYLAIFMVVMASGFLSKGQEYISSGLAAVITGSTPISMLIGVWLFAGEKRPTFIQFIGLAGGFIGLSLLVPPGEQKTEIFGAIWVLSATFGWVAGTIITKRNPQNSYLPVLQACGMILLCGGAECLIIGTFLNEIQMTRWENFNLRVGIAFAWMVVGGSIIAYSCYFWLLRNTSTALAVSYEYVVPIIGIFLGWLLAGERPSLGMFVACGLIICSVFFVLSGKKTS